MIVNDTAAVNRGRLNGIVVNTKKTIMKMGLNQPQFVGVSQWRTQGGGLGGPTPLLKPNSCF